MPKGWEVAQLTDSDVSEIIMGQSPPSDSYNTEGKGLPFYQGKTDFGNCYPTTTKWCSAPIKIAKANDILMSVRAPVGDVNICAEDSCIGRGITAIRSGDKIYYEYLFYYLLKQKPYIEMLGTGAIFKSINKTILGEMTIYLPPFSEQKTIAKTLSTIQKAIETQDKIIANVQELKKATMERFFTRQNNQCKEVEIGKICSVERGGSPRPIQDYITDSPDGINWIKIGDASSNLKYIRSTKEKIKPEGMKKSRLVNEGDLLLSNSMSFGRPYLMKTSGCIHDGWLVLKDISGIYDQEYLFYFLQSPLAYSQFNSLASGSTVRNLNIDLVKKATVRLYKLGEQSKIAKIFQSIDGKIEHHEAKKSNLQDFFKSVLDKLMKGGN